jgi:hypothetical protein
VETGRALRRILTDLRWVFRDGSVVPVSPKLSVRMVELDAEGCVCGWVLCEVNDVQLYGGSDLLVLVLVLVSDMELYEC